METGHRIAAWRHLDTNAHGGLDSAHFAQLAQFAQLAEREAAHRHAVTTQVRVVARSPLRVSARVCQQPVRTCRATQSRLTGPAPACGIG
jgi:hypothetical protein